MTITANDIITTLWELANTTRSKTRGKKTGSQKFALKLLLDIRGGLEFIVRRPGEELEELERQGICSANLRAVLRELARVELQRRQALRDLAGLELQKRRLLGARALADSVGELEPGFQRPMREDSGKRLTESRVPPE
jgi:hypothetical protein